MQYELNRQMFSNGLNYKRQVAYESPGLTQGIICSDRVYGSEPSPYWEWRQQTGSIKIAGLTDGRILKALSSDSDGQHHSAQPVRGVGSSRDRVREKITTRRKFFGLAFPSP